MGTVLHNSQQNMVEKHFINLEYELSKTANIFVTEATYHCIEHNLTSAVKALKSILMRYEANAIDTVDNVDMVKILDAFLFLLQFHNSDDEFEYICAELSLNCCLNQCKILQFNYRKRYNCSIHGANPTETARKMILNKIHCYYNHTFDMGYRLNSNERALIKQSYENKHGENMLVNNAIKLAHHLVSSKALNSPVQCNKYISTEISNKTYNFGTEFDYGENEEVGTTEQTEGTEYTESSESTDETEEKVKVIPLHPNLKLELVCNQISPLTMEQFNAEYQKASIHLRSEYCVHKKFFMLDPTHQFATLYSRKMQDDDKHLSMDLVLSLMVYCNYSSISYEFSKTYRENIDQHTHFYHMGKNIKSAATWFGMYVADGEKFYHGISEKLLFDCIGSAVLIYGPLSTSSCFEVAVNFTNHNNGMIVVLEKNVSSWSSQNRFSLSWLSDYANEAEHLFIQNNRMDCITARMCVTDMITAKTGTSYKCIVKAMGIMDCGLGGPQKHKNEMDSTLLYVINRIATEQLQNFDEYSRAFIRLYYEGKRYYAIDYKISNIMYQSFLEIFYQPPKKSYFSSITKRFCNLTSFRISGLEWKVNTFLLKDIYAYFKQFVNKRMTLYINFINRKSSKTPIHQVLCRYQCKLQHLGCVVMLSIGKKFTLDMEITNKPMRECTCTTNESNVKTESSWKYEHKLAKISFKQQKKLCKNRRNAAKKFLYHRW
eukprot:96770_1